MSNRQYTNAVESIADLQARGFNDDLILMGNQLMCPQQKVMLKTAEFEILEMYYFRGNGAATRERMVYAIEAQDYGIKGILLITGAANTTVFPDVINNILRYNFVRSGNMAGAIL